MAKVHNGLSKPVCNQSRTRMNPFQVPGPRLRKVTRLFLKPLPIHLESYPLVCYLDYSRISESGKAFEVYLTYYHFRCLELGKDNGFFSTFLLPSFICIMISLSLCLSVSHSLYLIKSSFNLHVMLQFRQFVFFVHKNINDASNTKHKFYHILLISKQYKYRMIDC